MDAYERRREFRKQRCRNMRSFFMKDPLDLIAEAQGLGVPLTHAFHCAGPSLKRSRVLLPMSEEQRECLEEFMGTMAERYAEDYDRLAFKGD